MSRSAVSCEHLAIAAHLLLVIGHHAEVTVVLRHPGVARFASKVEVHVGDGAQVDLVSVQD